MVSPRYCTRSRTAAEETSSERTVAPSGRQQIVVRLRPHDVVADTAEPTASSPLARLADPLASPVVPSSPLVPLFLGMDDDMVVQSPPGSPPPARVAPGLSGEDYSPASPPPHDLNKVGTSRPARELTTPEHQAMWEAELARSPTPPPTANEIVDAILAPPRAVTPEYRLNVQPLTPPPRWHGR
ncbi:uncharacterized protein UHO2_00425 [Ustilago hordei]|uniref:uncharacterized protein n=1 Tax=Ustilago hordei TaxID=120017 RepID=UPI001A5F4AF6|nr:uncharacterized protein UHO2_00425 [Ustilago hordei]SYW81940.1 uncharacterized protein UHO2_00425 [Ustilago hordei]